ncbi:conserved hypothetical protein [Microsporum canis CBS 113480]|uniref:Uncharacterized protein n=1 Tax=Arthroderma otae (strain ATCC MYA-4605 / CBS 113480) TaxID=554155 RepID=C5G0K6_ARTOC|nr:conserved hypothetical protein [Microsporum canis CBS 113480]EEQ35659.1 conserved hypothetical protein [Microsporum canis CBS 113480]
MTALPENLAHVDQLEAWEEAMNRVDGEKTATFQVLRWDRNRYDIPSGFVLERARSVTHSFGASLAKDGTHTVWIHFLCTAASPDVARSEWLHSAVVLKWSAADGKHHGKAPVTLTCFRPMPGLVQRFHQLAEAADWTDVLQDPYLLLDMVFEYWFLCLDDSAWKTNDFCRDIEKGAFQGTKRLDAGSASPPAVDLHHVHTIAKNAIFMLEGVDATLRSLDAAVTHHQELSQTRPPVWRATHSSLLYRKELFHSTRLRIISVEKRLQNIINLAFNMDAMQNSRITQRDSYSLKALSVAATVLLPLSTVATVFSTPFFEPSRPSSGGEKEGAETLLVNRKFWLLWAIAVPVTVALICGWWFLEKGFEPVLAGWANRIAQLVATRKPQPTDVLPGRQGRPGTGDDGRRGRIHSSSPGVENRR